MKLIKPKVISLSYTFNLIIKVYHMEKKNEAFACDALGNYTTTEKILFVKEI